MLSNNFSFCTDSVKKKPKKYMSFNEKYIFSVRMYFICTILSYYWVLKH